MATSVQSDSTDAGAVASSSGEEHAPRRKSRTQEIEEEYGDQFDDLFAAFSDSGLSDTDLWRLSGCDSFSDRFFRPWALRFLAARGGNVKEAVQMLLDGKKFFSDSESRLSLLPEPLPASIEEHIHCNYDEGVLPHLDYHNRLVYILRGGKTGETLPFLFERPSTIPEEQTWKPSDAGDAFLHWHVQLFEFISKVEFRRRARALGGDNVVDVDQLVMIDDLAGMSMKGMGDVMKFMPTMKAMSKIDQLLFPELLGNMYFINAPSFFTIMWKALGPFIDKRTREKIHVLGSDFLPTLQAILPLEHIPSFLGGTLEDFHVSSRENGFPPFFRYFRDYLEEQELKNGGKVHNIVRQPLQRIKIPARDTRTVSVAIAQGQYCRWQMKLSGYDLNMSAVFRASADAKNTESSTTVEVVPQMKFEAVDSDGAANSLCGRFECPSEAAAAGGGELTFTLDNAFSYLRDKVVRYRVIVADIIDRQDVVGEGGAAPAATE